VNIGMSFISSLFVAINLERFEILSHELAYMNEITLAFFDVMILGALLSKKYQIADAGNATRSFFAAAVGGVVSCVQLGIYNLSGWTPTGDSKGEQMAHYLEFAFGIISSLITFWFAIDNKLLADGRLAELMYGQDPDGSEFSCGKEEGPKVEKRGHILSCSTTDSSPV